MSVNFVFVHGVATRSGSNLKERIRVRDERFRKLVFGTDVTIHNPYWGEFGANPAGGSYRSLPDYENPLGDGVEALNVGDAIAEDAEAPSLIELARDDFPETVDLVFAEVLAQAQADAVDAEISDDLVIAAHRASSYAIHDPNPSWIQEDLTDAQFVKRLMRFAESRAATGPELAADVETLGIGSAIRNGARALVDRIRNAGGRFVLARKREGFHGHVAAFVGDVFRYLKDGTGRDSIRGRVREAVQPALADGGPVVLMGHSMGGVILADCLGDPTFRAEVGLTDARQVDALVTVGSQPGFFEELGLLAGREAGASPVDVVGVWFNVFDELDALSFRVSPLFGDAASDLRFSSRTGIADAHSAYFDRIQFYQRLRLRLRGAGIPVTEST